MSFTLHRLKPWTEVCGVDEEKIFAFGSIYNDQTINLNPAGGNTAIALSTVPAGEIWVVNVVTAFDFNHATTNCSIYKYTGGLNIYLAAAAALAADVMMIFTGAVPLAAGEYLAAFFGGVTAGDDLYIQACGYKMIAP